MKTRRTWIIIAMLSLAACGGGTAEERLQRAVAYQAEGRNQAAILELRNAVQRDPELAAARLLLGQVFLEVGEAAAAVVELERAQRLGVAGDELTVTLARARVASGETRHARQVVATWSQVEPLDLSAPLVAALARAHLMLGDTAQARELLTALSEREPDAAEAWLGLARLEMVGNDPKLALRHAEEAHRLDPDVLETAMAVGELRLAAGDTQGARRAYEAAITLATGREATTVSARMGLVRALMAAGELEQARPMLTQVLRDAPNFVEANYVKGWFHLQADELTQARPYLERVLKILPEHQDSRYLLAIIAFREGRNEQAQDALTRIVTRAPADLRARLLLANVYEQQGMHHDAVRVLRAGLTATGAEPHAAYKLALGQSLMRSGNHVDGLDMLEQAAVSAPAPDAAAIRTQLALAQLATGASSEAEAELIEVTELAEGFTPSEAFLIFMLIEARRFEEAVVAAERFATQYADVAMVHNMLAAAHLANSDEDAARRAMRQALEIDPNFAPAAVNLALLEAQAGDMAPARRRLAAVLAREPDHRGATIAMADLAYAQGDLDSTRRFVRDAWLAHRDDPELSLRLADLLARQGEPDRALEVLTGLGRDADVADEVLTARVRIGRQAGRVNEPVAALETLLLRHPADEEALLALARTLAGDRQTERAQDMIEQHLRDRDAAQTPLLILHAELLLHHQSFAAAETVLRVISQRDDAGAAAPLLQGDLALRRGQAEPAIQHYGEAHGLQPSQSTLRRLQAARAAAGRPEDGISDLSAWTEDHPDDRQIRTLLAELHLSRGEFEQAIAHYEALLAQDHQTPTLLNNLAWLYGKTDHPDAVATARRAHQLAPDRAPVQDTLGWLLLQEGHVEEALALLQQAAANSPEDPEIQYHLAVALNRSGERSAARRLLEPLLDARFDSATDARELFEQLGSL